jgi:alpha-tubulin suppressor-like RCC1 family protein
MHRIRFAAAVAAIASVLTLVACGSDSVSPTPTGNHPDPQPAVVKSVDLTPATASLAIGETKTLAATPRDANGAAIGGRTVSWTSSAASIAKVDANGVVSGVAAGTATITATSDGVSGTAAITVNAPVPVVRVASVSVTTALDTLEAYDPHTMQAIVRDSANNVLTGRAVKWTSSNPAVATIDANTGMLMGVDRGTVTITAESETKTGSASRVIVIKYRSIAAGSMHACDIASGGFVWCWGENGTEGRIGMATLGDNAMSATPVLVPNTGYTALRFTQLSSFGIHTCGVTADARAYCWGSNAWGRLAAPSGVGQSPTPVNVSSTISFKQVSVGSDHSCGLATDSHAYCWGHNDWREFGSADPTNTYTPVAILPNMTFSSISAGSGFTCGIATTGAAYCWGQSGWGQLGDGSKISYGNTFSATPVAVANGAGLKSIDGAYNFTCALNAANQALCWGNNGGHLGNGGTTETSTPTAVAGGLTFSSVSAGNGHVCGVATDASVWCWGNNDHGQLGASAPAVATSPIRAGGSLLAAEVAAAGVSTGFGNHTCAISRDRLTAYCFGRNETGQLGNGATTTATASNPIPSIVVGQKPLP